MLKNNKRGVALLLVGLAACSQAQADELRTGRGITRVLNNGTYFPPYITEINFSAGATQDGTVPSRVDVTAGGGGGGTNYQTVQLGGVAQTQQPILDLIGSAISCSNNGGATRTECTWNQTPSNALNLVGDTRTLTCGNALTGCGNLQADRTLAVTTSPASQTPVGTTRTLTCGNSLSGCGDLSADRTLAVTTSPAGQTAVGVTRNISTTNGLTGGGALSSDLTLAPTYGFGANTFLQGSDTLDQFNAPAASVSLNSQKITNLATCTGANDACPKVYIDSLVQGLETKPPVRVKTTAALAANTYTFVACAGDTIVMTANGALTIDGVALALLDRVLIANEGTTSHDGIYTVTQQGTGILPTIFTRATDMNASSEFPGAYVLALQGTTNQNTAWTLVADPDVAFTCGTTGQTWLQFSGTGDIIAGNGIAKSGNTLSVATTLPDNYTMNAAGVALTVTNGVTVSGTLTNSTHTAAAATAMVITGNASGSKFLTTAGTGLDIDGFGGVNVKKNGSLLMDWGVTGATAGTCSANTSFNAAAGTGGLGWGSASGDWTMPTGTGTWGGASGKALSLQSTAAALTIATLTSGTLAVTSAGALNLTGVAASTFAFSGGAYILQTTSQNLTIQTITSGTLAITGAGAVNISAAAASSISTTSGNYTIDAASAVNVGQTNATSVGLGRSAQSTTVNGNFTTSQDYKMNGVLSPASISSNQTDYNPANLANNELIRQDCSAAVTINSLAANTAGRTFLWCNISGTTANTQTFLSDDGATGTAAERILTPGNANYVLKSNGCVWLRYDGVSSRWRVSANFVALIPFPWVVSLAEFVKRRRRRAKETERRLAA